jgi:hypothetical protein
VTDGERDAAARPVKYYTPLESVKDPTMPSVRKHWFPLNVIHLSAHPRFGHATPEPNHISKADNDKEAAPATPMPAPAALPPSVETPGQKNSSATDSVRQTPAPRCDSPSITLVKCWLPLNSQHAEHGAL